MTPTSFFTKKPNKMSKDRRVNILSKRTDITGQRFVGRVIEIIDGDSFCVVIDTGWGSFVERQIRLARVDTPEMYKREPGAKEATDYCVENFLGEDLEIEYCKMGKYRRRVCELYFQGANVPDMLIAEDLGVDKY